MNPPGGALPVAEGAGPEAAPLILTLAFDERSFARFEALRRAHFPPERNLIPAHLTLFHHLPGTQLPVILGDLRRTCRDEAPFPLAVTGLRSLGRGVALALAAPELERLRDRLAALWSDWLIPQDRQAHRPHVTIQNKVEPAAAKTLLADLSAGFAPWSARAEGLLLWRYHGGPWERLARLPFTARRS